MRIMVKTPEGWKATTSKEYGAEINLQDLLYEEPTLIPFEDLGGSEQVTRVPVKELGLPGSGSTDLLIIDGNGGITLIECKLAHNPEAKRAVVGQLLEYAAHLWRMPVETFESLVQKRLGKPLAESLDLDGEAYHAFRRELHKTLSEGTFTLLIATDALEDQVRRIIEYFNAAAPTRLKLFALETAYFDAHGVQFVAPTLHGPVRPAPPGPPESWDEPKFFRVLERNTSPDVVEVSRQLLRLVQTLGETAWGSGKVEGSFVSQIVRDDGAVLSVFSVDTVGRLWLYLDPYLTTKQVPLEAIEQYKAKLKENPTLRPLPSDKYNKSFKLKEVLASPEAIGRFSEAVRELATEWKGQGR